jgi:hypothetical protein
VRRNWTVIRAHGHAPAIVEAVAFGGLAGCIFSFARLSIPMLPIAVSSSSIVLLVVVAAICTFPRRCWHFGFHTLRGVVLGVAFFSGALVAEPDYFVAQISPWSMAGFFMVTSLLGALGSILLHCTRAALFGRPIVQDGEHCPKCAYVIAHLPGNRCPECGTEFSAADIAPAPSSYLSEWRPTSRRLLICLVLFGTSYLVYPYALTELLLALPGGTTADSTRDCEWMSFLNRRPAATARVLCAWLERPDPNARGRAAELAMYFKSTSLDNSLANSLAQHAQHDPESIVRETCLGSLYYVSATRLTDLMPVIRTDDDPMVRWVALATLSSWRTRGTPWLIAALDDVDEQVREFTYKRLCYDTGQQFPFDPKAPRDERLRQQAAWQEWWSTFRQGSP